MTEFEEVYRTYGRKVYGFLCSLTGDPAWAEELLQETFYQAFLHIEKFEGRCSLYTWLCQIGKNAWLKERKRSKRFSFLTAEEHLSETMSPDAEETMLQKEEIQRARQAMHSLPEPYQTVFILHALTGIKLKEIAALYGKSESWARVTYFRAKTKLYEEVTK